MELLDLLKEENFERLSLDERLSESFIRVITKISDHFKVSGYNVDYSNLLETKLMNDKEKYKIIASDEPRKINFNGFYMEDRIEIDESILNGDPEVLDHTLCHEFIHFLTISNDKGFLSGNHTNDRFSCEALTEGLTNQMYPKGYAYRPQVLMMNYANYLTGNHNDYSAFLKGRIPGYESSPMWHNYQLASEAYQSNFSDKGFYMETAIVDPDYIKAQYGIITFFNSRMQVAFRNEIDASRQNKGMTFDEYILRTKDFIALAPIKNEYLTDSLKKLDMEYVNSVYPFHDKQVNSEQRAQLVSEINDVRNKINGFNKPVVKVATRTKMPTTLTLDGEVIRVSVNNMSVTVAMSGGSFNASSYDRSTKELINISGECTNGIVQLHDKDGHLVEQVDMSKETLLFDEEANKKKIEETKERLNKNSYDDFKITNAILDSIPDIVSIDKFEFPKIYKKAMQPIYVVNVSGSDMPQLFTSRGNEIVKIGNPIAKVPEMPLLSYMGVTSHTNTGAVMPKKQGNATDGLMYKHDREEHIISYLDSDNKYNVGLIYGAGNSYNAIQSTKTKTLYGRSKKGIFNKLMAIRQNKEEEKTNVNAEEVGRSR